MPDAPPLRSLRAADGTDLFVRTWPAAPESARRGSVLIVHGLGEHGGRYGHVAAALAELGLEVRCHDQRGHGRSGGVRGGIPHDGALLDDLEVVFGALAEDAAADGDGAPPFLLGHSLGGAIAALAVTSGRLAPRGLILSSPALALRVSPLQRLSAAIGRRAIPDRPVPNGLKPRALSHDPAVVAAYVADEHVHDRITARLFGVLAESGRLARRDAGRLDVPTLLLVAGADEIIDSAGSRELLDAMPAGAATVRWYDGLCHELFNEREPDRSRVLADLREWVELQLAG